MENIPVDQMNNVPLENTLAEDLSRLKDMNGSSRVSYITWFEEERRIREYLKPFGLGLECDEESSIYYVYALKDKE